MDRSLDAHRERSTACVFRLYLEVVFGADLSEVESGAGSDALFWTRRAPSKQVRMVFVIVDPPDDVTRQLDAFEGRVVVQQQRIFVGQVVYVLGVGRVAPRFRSVRARGQLVARHNRCHGDVSSEVSLAALAADRTGSRFDVAEPEGIRVTLVAVLAMFLVSRWAVGTLLPQTVFAVDGVSRLNAGVESAAMTRTFLGREAAIVGVFKWRHGLDKLGWGFVVRATATMFLLTPGQLRFITEIGRSWRRGNATYSDDNEAGLVFFECT